MAKDEPPRPASTDASLSADQIEQQTFSRARKGVDENEVRDFLRQVAAKYAALTRRVAELEEQLQHPRLPSEQQLVELVGEEVARTLRSAHESSEKVTNRARERAAQIEQQASERTQRLRAEQLEQATQDARAIVEAARERGRDMVVEARALRERVISDLNRRRDLLRDYLEQLRADRDRFAETYRAVRGTLRDAHDELARIEAGRPFQPVPVDVGPAPTLPPEPKPKEEPSAQPEPAPAAAKASTRTAPEGKLGDRSRRAEPAPATGIGLGELPGRPEPPPPPAPAPPPAPRGPEPTTGHAMELELEPEIAPAETDEAEEPEVEPEPEPEPRGGVDVDTLFQRIRAGREQEAAPAVADDGAGNDNPAHAAAPADIPAAAPVAESQPEAANGDGELLERRDSVLAPVAHDLVRRCKRLLQDEQNEVLDALRRQRGRITPDKLLPPVAAQLASWIEVMTPAIDEAYVAARAATASSQSSPVFSAPGRIVTVMVEVVVTPLRDRLLAAVEETLADDPKPDPDVIAHRIGSRYREWKGQELDSRIGDVLAAVYARGVYDATPDGSLLRWVPAAKGQCPDADDNALEPTPRGERFPTGQQFPPAHPGCRCVLAVVHEGRSSD